MVVDGYDVLRCAGPWVQLNAGLACRPLGEVNASGAGLPSDQLPLLTLNACDLIGQQIGNLALPFDDALLLENQELVERSL